MNDFIHVTKTPTAKPSLPQNKPLLINQKTAAKADSINTAGGAAIDYFETLEIACGHFRQSNAEQATQLIIPEYYRANPKTDFMAKAKGHSMDGGKNPIKDGDVLLFERITPQSAGSNQGQVIAIEKTDAAGDNIYLLRKVKKADDGQYQSVAFNPDYTVQIADDSMRTLARFKAVIEQDDI